MDVAGLRDRLQRDMTTFAGVLRDGPGLEQAAASVAAVDAALTAGEQREGAGRTDERAVAELRTLLCVGRGVVSAASERRESRGSHHRLDHPEPRQPPERIVYFGPDRRVRAPVETAVSERER